MQRAIHGVIRELQAMQDTAMLLSGEGSGLTNVWDEICAQQQVEESFAWPAYAETIRAVIQGRVEDLPGRRLIELWLRTENGEDWSADSETGAEPVPVVSDVAEFLFAETLSQASDYTNARIRAFADRDRFNSA